MAVPPTENLPPDLLKDTTEGGITENQGESGTIDHDHQTVTDLLILTVALIVQKIQISAAEDLPTLPTAFIETGSPGGNPQRTGIDLDPTSTVTNPLVIDEVSQIHVQNETYMIEVKTMTDTVDIQKGTDTWLQPDRMEVQCSAVIMRSIFSQIFTKDTP